jgi:branched-chain amino acid transport system ATP-binding protein
MTHAVVSSALEIRDLRLRVAQTDILCGISMSIHAGERIGVIGPNGAGKSTLFDLISGRQKPSSGQVLLGGQRIDGQQAFEVNRLGLARSFQISQLFPKLSVYENLRCGVMWSLGYRYTFWKFLADMTDVNQRAYELMHLLQLDHVRDALAMNLSYAQQRTLDIGITVAGNAAVLLLDEPTAGMSRSETRRFMTLLNALTVGKTLLLVEHDMSVVFGLADKIAVLVQGQLLAFDTPESVRADARVQQAYLGLELAQPAA